MASARTSSRAGHTWFVRPDGGTRYSYNNPRGQCNGKYDAAYPGSGINKNCAYNDFRLLWDDDSGQIGGAGIFWVISGGDTVVIRGCHALPSQVNPSNPNCRLGYDNQTGIPPSLWCGAGYQNCYNPPIPAGTSSNPTRILGACAYGTYTCNPVGHSYPYTSNLTQIFCGFGQQFCINLQSTSYVEIEGIELTTHNQHWNGIAWAGNCTNLGNKAYPVYCANSSPYDDYAKIGFFTATGSFPSYSTNITLQDVYIHGFTSSGLYGPIGANWTATNVFIGFNAFAGWNFADAKNDPNGPNASLSLNYVWMEGNGCFEQYPIANTQFPARACYDDNSGGFGDSLSGQDADLASLSANHFTAIFNTKDGFIGPHTFITALRVTNSYWYGNMGSALKFAGAPNSAVLFQNNLVVGNCMRMNSTVPGAAQNFNATTGLGGSYLDDFCRAGGNTFAFDTFLGSTNYFYGNTVIGASATMIEVGCGVSGKETNCGSVPILWQDNIFLGYIDPSGYSGGEAPALYYNDPGSHAVSRGSYNVEYGIRNGDTCGRNIICSDPLLAAEPAQARRRSEAALDVFNPFNAGNSFELTASSPAKGRGNALSGLITDYYGTTRPNPPAIGALEYGAHAR
jgi:hypothetical protein